MNLSHENLINRIEHYIKNKLQGTCGGNFLIESGLRTSDLQAIAKGWQIVSHNQTELLRCVSHLSTLSKGFVNGQEPCPIHDLLKAALDEIEGQTDKIHPVDLLSLESEFTETALCLIEFSCIRSAIFGLLRICAACCQGKETSTISIAIFDDTANAAEISIRFVCYGVDVIFNPEDMADEFVDSRLNEALIIEWEVAKYAIGQQNGSLSLIRDGDAQFTIEIALPKYVPTGLVPG